MAITRYEGRAIRVRPVFEELARQERTQIWLARKLGISPSYRIYRIADGRVPAPDGFVERSAQALQVSVADIFEARETA